MTRSKNYFETLSQVNTLKTSWSPRYMSQVYPKEEFLKVITEMCLINGIDSSVLNSLNAIHVAGSKGKGSVAAFLFSILSQYLAESESKETSPKSPGVINGIGLFTSPHLQTALERIRLRHSLHTPFAATKISPEVFVDGVDFVWDRLELNSRLAVRPAWSSFMMILALYSFWHQGVNTAIMEVNVGGRFCSTNIFPQPSVCVITSLALEHTSRLGNHIADIAWAKGGIIKQGRPVLTFEQQPEAMAVLEKIARENDTTLQVVRQEHPEMHHLQLGLQGDIQRLNATMASAVAATHLHNLGYHDVPAVEDLLAGTAPLPEKFKKGLEETEWPGRFETWQRAGVTWYLDGAHTVESVQLAGSWFAERVKHNGPRVLIFNQQSRPSEQREEMLRSLISTLRTTVTAGRSVFDYAIFCTNLTWMGDSEFSPEAVMMNTKDGRTLPENILEIQYELAEMWKALGGGPTMIVKTTEEAIQHVYHMKCKPQCLITGSLHLIGSAMDVLDTLV